MRPAARAVLTCPGRGAARNEVERCTADPGPPQTGTVPGLQRTTSCCAAPGTRERGDPLLRGVKNQPTRVVGSAPLFPACY